MPTFFDQLKDFSGGVVTTTGQTPETASPRGRNSLLRVAPGGVEVRKRTGLTTVNQTNGQAFNATILNQIQYRQLSGTTYTSRHILAGSGGQIGFIASDPGGTGAYTSISTALTADKVPAFAQAKNLLFLVNGPEQKKLRGATLEEFGIAPPSTAPTLAAGASGTPDGTYEGRVTFYNNNTAHESSAGPTSSTVTVNGEIISFTSVPVSSDAQVTHRRIYIRNTATQANFYLATTIADNTTTTASFDAADSTLITRGPDTDENDAPPDDVNSIAWHRSRMFVADTENLYYSKLEKPESFDPENYEPINPQDGQQIIVLLSVGDILLIFKEKSVYGLFGADPESWIVRLLIADVGCVSARSLRVIESLLYWWSHLGPVRWDGTGRPDMIGERFIKTSISTDALEYNEFPNVVAEFLPQDRVMLWMVSTVDGSTNTIGLAFHVDLGVFTTDNWDPLAISSLAAVEDGNGQVWTYAGNYNGQLFRFDGVANDGVPGGTVTGSVTVGATSIGTITDVAAAFYTTGQGLKHREVRLEDSDGEFAGKAQITSNTATALTLTANITGLTDGATYTYIVGGPNFEWDSPEMDGASPFIKKRYEFLYTQVESQTGTLKTSVFVSGNTTSSLQLSASTSTSGSTITNLRQRIALVGRSWKARWAERTATADVTLYEMAMRGDLQTDKN